MKRNKTTGQFSKPIFELYLQDFGNLSIQLLDVSKSRLDLEQVALALNNAFARAGQNDQWSAEVHESNETRGVSK